MSITFKLAKILKGSQKKQKIIKILQEADVRLSDLLRDPYLATEATSGSVFNPENQHVTG
jgi:hypothetical protein